jgi:hypothetical protein
LSGPLILVGSLVIIKNKSGEILLQQRKHPHDFWGLPGELMELGESTEETGLTIGKCKMIDVISGASNYAKAANGDEFYMVTIV